MFLFPDENLSFDDIYKILKIKSSKICFKIKLISGPEGSTFATNLWKAKEWYDNAFEKGDFTWLQKFNVTTNTDGKNQSSSCTEEEVT